jgi:hypothetical protein
VRAPAGAFLLFLATAASSLAAGPPAQSPDYGPIAASDQAAGRAAIEECRRAVPDQCYYEFTLQVRPRRGDLRSIPGQLWASHNEQGPVMRLILGPGTLDERRWLIQGGPQPAAWRTDGAGPARAASITDPLVPGVEITPFDLQLSFLYWPDEALLSVTRLMGRPTYVFHFRPPAAFAAQHPEITGVRVSLDTQYKQPRRTELLGANAVLKTMTVNDVKLDPAIVKEVDFRNEMTRDTTRFEVTAAAVHLDLLPALFTPDELGTAFQPPASHLILRF